MDGFPFLRYFGLAAGVELPRPLAGCCVLLYSTLFSCNLQEAEPSSVWEYASLGTFFTRWVEQFMDCSSLLGYYDFLSTPCGWSSWKTPPLC